MVNILEKIILDKKENLILVKKNNSLDSLEKKIKSLNFFNNFKKAIQNNKGISLISEIKKASPSAGVLVKDFNHLNIAKIYIDNGTTCLSVLTEEKHFLGKLDYIADIKNKFKIPVLAKDFFIDPYQIALSKSYGCDCILLIIAALNGNQADEIHDEAIKHNLSVIVEVHDQKEAETALKYNRRLSPITFPVMIRLKSIGKMGYYKDSYTYSLDELKQIVMDMHGDSIKFINTIDGHTEQRSLMYSFPTKAGTMLGKITDWTVDVEGVPDAGSTR